MAFGLLTWDRFYLSRYFDFASHLGRVTHNEPWRLTSRVLMWKSLKSLKSSASITGHQGHFRRIKVFRWEQPIYDYCRNLGLDWLEASKDREGFHVYKQGFVDDF